jgi:hypothetical protein
LELGIFRCRPIIKPTTNFSRPLALLSSRHPLRNA